MLIPNQNKTSILIKKNKVINIKNLYKINNPNNLINILIKMIT